MGACDRATPPNTHTDTCGYTHMCTHILYHTHATHAHIIYLTYYTFYTLYTFNLYHTCTYNMHTTHMYITNHTYHVYVQIAQVYTTYYSHTNTTFITHIPHIHKHAYIIHTRVSHRYIICHTTCIYTHHVHPSYEPHTQHTHCMPTTHLRHIHMCTYSCASGCTHRKYTTFLYQDGDGKDDYHRLIGGWNRNSPCCGLTSVNQLLLQNLGFSKHLAKDCVRL